MNNKKPITYPKNPTWCPGCGNYGIWGAIKQAAIKSQIPTEKIVITYDVGCSGNMADYNNFYGFHALHGRAIPPATGIKLANHDLTPIVIIGDGGCYGEGGTHFINEMRGNHDITVLVHNNHRYSLTTGQMSPTTKKGTKTKSTPQGSIEEAFNPMAIAVSNHATFIAREFAGDIPSLANRIAQAITHPGFAVIDILQPCVVFNPEQSYDWYRQNMVKLEDEKHDSTNKEAAWKQAMRTDKLPIGLFYQDKNSVPYHSQVAEIKDKPLVDKPIESVDISKLVKNFQ